MAESCVELDQTAKRSKLASPLELRSQVSTAPRCQHPLRQPGSLRTRGVLLPSQSPAIAWAPAKQKRGTVLPFPGAVHRAKRGALTSSMALGLGHCELDPAASRRLGSP